MVPFLRRFKANWATETYLRRSLRNQKGYLMRRAAKRAATGIDTSDIRFDDDRGTGLNDDRGSEDGEEGVLGEIDDC